MLSPGARRVCTGVTLVELIAFLVVVSIGAVALLGAYRNILPRAPTPAQITQASLLAQERMALILGERAAKGYASLNLDPCASSVLAFCTSFPNGFGAPTVVGANALVPWQGNPTTSYRQITVTATGPGGISLSYVAVLANY